MPDWLFCKGVPVELFVTGTGAGISGANTGGAGTGTGIFPCQRPTPRGEIQRWTGDLRWGGGGRGRPTCRPCGAAQVTPARSALHCSTVVVKQETMTFSSFFSTGTGSPNLPVPVFSGIAKYRPVPVPIRVPAHPY